MQEGLRKGQAGGLPLWNELRLCGQWAEPWSAFYGPGMPGGAGPHPAEPQGPGHMAAGKTGAGSKPWTWLWKPGEERPTGGSVPTGTSGYMWHGPVPHPAVAHWTWASGLLSLPGTVDCPLGLGKAGWCSAEHRKLGVRRLSSAWPCPRRAWSWKNCFLFWAEPFPQNEISFRALRWKTGSNKTTASEPPPHHFLPRPTSSFNP